MSRHGTTAIALSPGPEILVPDHGSIDKPVIDQFQRWACRAHFRFTTSPPGPWLA
jgi:hypothetical protein